MLEVYKASAGSGKTETLTRKYISLLLDSNEQLDNYDAYRNILAVTFTNKATDEMKERVLKSLFNRSKEDSETGIKARKTLVKLLHDYSAFSITTIDKFFQKVTRSFAREIGQYASYRVELSDKNVLSLAVDTMFDSLDKEENKQLLDILVHYALEILEDSGENNISKMLLNMASLFFKEDFRIKKLRAQKDGRFYTDSESIDKIERDLKNKISSFENTLKKLTEESLEIISSVGINGSDFTYTRDTYESLKKFLNIKGPVSYPKTRLWNFISSPDAWFSKKDVKKLSDKRNLAISNGLLDKFIAIKNLFETEYFKYRSTFLIIKNLYVFRLFNEIYKNIYKVLKEKNMMLLSETTEAIHSIIGGSDVPFIYEKIGNRYDHFMLDEFQDTSILQWENFVPLLKNSLASDNYNMIVGDVKQSIYRWRGSDWKTLDSGLGLTFREDQVSYPLIDKNYRSAKEIVNFNCDFFAQLGEAMGEPKISEIYSTVKQVPQKSFNGYININFCDTEKGDWREGVLKNLKYQILKLTQEQGYPYSSIAVLTRKNKEAKLIAEQLIRDGFPVISEDALVVSTSPQVNKIVTILSALNNTNDKQSEYLLNQNNINLDNLRSLVSINESHSLYDLCEEIIRLFCSDIEDEISTNSNIPIGEIVYINAFLDIVLDYQKNEGSNTLGFLSWWEEIGSQTTISMPDLANAIQVFTVHKAKGLEMDIVILPFFDMNLSAHNNSGNNYIWGIPPRDVSELGLFPMKVSKDMLETVFKQDYEHEQELIKIDTVNIAYVAFTRPKVELITFSPKSTSKRRNYISDYLYEYLVERYGESDSYDIGKKIDYQEYCDLNIKKNIESEQDDTPLQIEIDKFVSVPPKGKGERTRLKILYQSEGFFNNESNRIRGIVLHEIMSSIVTENDLQNAVISAVREGKLSEEDSARVLQLLSLKIKSHPEWFDGKMQVLNEAVIINESGNVRRPDRILLDGDNVIVIDYKFGEEHPKHKDQILYYMNTLKKMGYSKISGHLWYVEENRVINFN